LPETQAHVLGICINTKHARIRRHYVVLRVKGKLTSRSPDTIVYHEQEFTNDDNEKLHPDLVAVTGGMAEIIDVTVRYEDGEALQDAVNEKSMKYECLCSAIPHCHPEVKDLVVLPLVSSRRGAVTHESVKKLEYLGFAISDVKGMSTNILRSSLSILSDFLDH
jgi:hypothetical protein